jgi:hypothetical protein
MQCRELRKIRVVRKSLKRSRVPEYSELSIRADFRSVLGSSLLSSALMVNLDVAAAQT